MDMDLNCLLCRGVVSFSIMDHTFYEEHLTVDHKILFYIPWIIEKTLQKNEEDNSEQEIQDTVYETTQLQEDNEDIFDETLTQEDCNDEQQEILENEYVASPISDFDCGNIKTEMQTYIMGDTETCLLPSVKTEFTLDNKCSDDGEGHIDNKVDVTVFKEEVEEFISSPTHISVSSIDIKNDPYCESPTSNNEDNSGSILMSENDPISCVDQKIDYSGLAFEQIQGINLPEKSLTDMSMDELLYMYKINNFKTPTNRLKKRVITMLRSKLVDSVTGRLTDDGVRAGLNLLESKNIIAIKPHTQTIKRKLGLIRNALKRKCPFWVKVLRDMLNDKNVICGPTSMEDSTLFKQSRDGKQMVCNLCPGVNGLGKTFLNTNALKCHMETHVSLQDRRTFDCELCRRSYVTKVSLDKHALTCTGFENQLSCALCPEIFCSKSELKKHKLVHKQNEENLERCLKCGKTFKLLQDWHSHVKQCITFIWK